jgi:hypothetical protein
VGGRGAGEQAHTQHGRCQPGQHGVQPCRWAGATGLLHIGLLLIGLSSFLAPSGCTQQSDTHQDSAPFGQRGRVGVNLRATRISSTWRVIGPGRDLLGLLLRACVFGEAAALRHSVALEQGGGVARRIGLHTVHHVELRISLGLGGDLLDEAVGIAP